MVFSWVGCVSSMTASLIPTRLPGVGQRVLESEVSMTTKADLTVPAIVRPLSGAAVVAADVQALEARHVLQTYRRAPITFVRGQGVRLYDNDGREYIDLLSGIGVTALGHAHPRLTRAIADQAETL